MSGTRTDGDEDPADGKVSLALGLAAGLALAAAAALVAASPAQAATEEAKLTAGDASDLDTFGGAVVVDGHRALVGADGHDKDADDERANYGAAYLFTRSGGTWSEEAMLSPSNLPEGASFGASVALDGTTAVVGAPGDEVEASYDVRAGAAYVYDVSDGEPTLEAKLAVDRPRRGLDVGSSVAVDDDTALAGAPGETSATVTGEPTGDTVYVFTREDAWSQAATIESGEEDHIGFGTAVAFDGHRALVGAPLADPGAGLDDEAGAAYTFTMTEGNWTDEDVLVHDDPNEEDHFGASVALDGDVALVGAPTKDMNLSAESERDHGAAYGFERGGGDWTQAASLAAPGMDPFAHFGTAVALAGNAGFVGAPQEDGEGDSQGAAFQISISQGNWTEPSRFKAADTDEGDSFGSSLATDGSRVLVGASRTDEGGDRRGAAYVFTMGSSDGSGGDGPLGGDGADGAPGPGALAVLAAGAGAALVRRRAL